MRTLIFWDLPFLHQYQNRKILTRSPHKQEETEGETTYGQWDDSKNVCTGKLSGWYNKREVLAIRQESTRAISLLWIICQCIMLFTDCSNSSSDWHRTALSTTLYIPDLNPIEKLKHSFKRRVLTLKTLQ